MNVLQSRMVGFGSDETNLATSRSSRILLCPANTVSPFSVAFFGSLGMCGRKPRRSGPLVRNRHLSKRVAGRIRRKKSMLTRVNVPRSESADRIDILTGVDADVPSGSESYW